MPKEHKDKHFIKQPIYEGGPTAMRKFIGQHLSYPKAAQEKKIEGTVALKYEINYKGKVQEAKVISSVGHGCDEEAIRLVKMLEFKVPKTRGVKVVFHKKIKIHFRLKKEQPKAKVKTAATQLQYNITSTTDTKKENPGDNGSYHYTVNF